MGNIKKLPPLDRPREKALRFGLENLSDQELIAILISSGTKNNSAIDIASHLLSEKGGLFNLSIANYNELIKYKGISKVNALKIISAFELGRRNTAKSVEIEEGKADKDYLIKKYSPQFQKFEQETLLVISLNKKRRIIKETFLYRGTSEETSVSIKEILKELISAGAYSFFLVHNHPNMESKPSYFDIALTTTLIKETKKLGINLLDHIIISKTDTFSFKESKTI